MHKHLGHNVIEFNVLQEDEAKLLKDMCQQLWSFSVKFDLMRRISHGTHSAKSVAQAIGNPPGVLDGPYVVFRDKQRMCELEQIVSIWLNKLVESNRVDTTATWVPINIEGHS